MKRYMHFYTIALLLIIIIGVLTGCPSTKGGDPVDATITGTVYDSYTTEPVANITVTYGSSSTTTNGSGEFSLEISGVPEGGYIKDSFLLYGNGYRFMYIEELAIDPDGENTPDIPVVRQSISGYTTKEITGDTFLNNGTTEITSFSPLAFNIGNGNRYYKITTLYFSDYTITTPVFGDDCLVSGFADMSSNPFPFLLTGIDLSGASPITLNITEPDPAALETISVAFDTVGNSAYGLYDTPYGFIPVTGRFLYDGGLGENVIISEILNSDQAAESVEIYNPGAWSGYWNQEEVDESFGADNVGHNKVYISTGSIAAISAIVNLPPVNTSLGPDEPADADSLAFADNVLSQSSVAGADVYYYTVSQSGNTLGTIFSFGRRVTLPDTIQTLFAGKNIRFNFTVRDYETDIIGLDTLEAFPETPQNCAYGEVSGSYQVQIQF